MTKDERIRMLEIAAELEAIQENALRFAELLDEQFMKELLYRDVIVGINAVIGNILSI